MTISATSTTAEIYAADVTANLALDADWTSLTVPTDLSTFIETYASDTFASYLGVYGFDLSDFFTDCATSDYCDDYFFEYRYDGLAMVSCNTFTFAASSTTSDTFAKFAFCIEEDEQCFGWLLGENYTTLSANYYF